MFIYHKISKIHIQNQQNEKYLCWLFLRSTIYSHAFANIPPLLWPSKPILSLLSGLDGIILDNLSIQLFILSRRLLSTSLCVALRLSSLYNMNLYMKHFFENSKSIKKTYTFLTIFVTLVFESLGAIVLVPGVV